MLQQSDMMRVFSFLLASKVAFTSVGDQNYGPFDRETIVVFNKVVTNIGNGYDNSTGKYKSPILITLMTLYFLTVHYDQIFTVCTVQLWFFWAFQNFSDEYFSFISTGIFKAPVSGYFYFSFSYHSSAQFPTGLRLKKNGQVIVEAYNDKPQGPEFTDNAGNSACLELSEGDQVSMYLPAKSAVRASGTSTTFSGFLISLL